MLVITGAGFSLISGVTWFLRWFFLLGVALGVLRVGFLATLAGWQWLSSRNSMLLVLSGTKLPFVSVIVPVHNESIVVERTIQALLRTKYPRYEVIVVDDGSSDNTAEVLRKKFGHIPNVRLLSQENLGKAAALNHGLEHAKGDIIVTADGDTLFEPGTVSALCSAFLDPKVVAVAGNTKVGNRRNLLTRMQALEYITSQNLERRAFTQLNCVTVVPGAVGAWRAENIRAVGGFPVNTLAEDADLTLLLLAHGGKVVYVPQAKAYTEAPETWSGLLRQRFRWSFGTLQAGWKQRQVLFRWKSGALGWVGLPNLFIFQLCFPFMAPILDLIAFSSIAWVFLQTFQHPHDTFWGELVLPLGFYAGFLLLDMLMGVLSFLLEDKEDLRLLWLLPLQRFIYRHLLYFVVAQAIFTAWHGGHPGWRKVERWGSVNLEKLVLPTKKSR